jgi:hypothetical protein
VTSKKKNGEAKLVAQNQPDDLGTGKKEKKESAIKLSSFRTYSKKVKSEPTKLYDEFNVRNSSFTVSRKNIYLITITAFKD